MTTEKISETILIRVTDWEGLYIDGKLVDEESTMDLPWHLDGKTVSFTFCEGTEADDNYVTNVGGFPDTWDELMDHRYMWEEDHR